MIEYTYSIWTCRKCGYESPDQCLTSVFCKENKEGKPFLRNCMNKATCGERKTFAFRKFITESEFDKMFSKVLGLE